MDNRDEIIRRQMDEIGRLINNSLENLSKELFVPKRCKNPVEEKDDKIVQFPINRRVQE